MPTPHKNGLYIPEPQARPGEAVDFKSMVLEKAGAVPKLDFSLKETELRHLPYALIRTLDEDGNAVGEWTPDITDAQKLNALKSMLLTRLFDDRLFKLQRQGKTSFYMKSRGEEALSVVPSLALQKEDMCFPTYRLVGWLMARGYPLKKLINQIFSNASDPLKGRQLPILYSAREYGFYSLSGNVGSRFGHAVGWAMAKAYRGTNNIAIGYIGEGTTAEGDFHEALTFASVYRAPVILCVTNNQWAISTFSGIAGANETTFAAKALGYGLPGLRVDGNDVLAVWAVTQWAAQRARAGLGATLIEFFTYRTEGHSTSDDPSQYRPKDEANHWPLGDPLERLKQHLINLKLWDEEQHMALTLELSDLIKTAVKDAEAIGTLGNSKPPVKEMFEDVFKDADWRILEQRAELGI